ncbi:2-(5'-triphosphoribosyl)-3'-dephospho CoA synthase, partial [Streptomyces sp. MB09-02B]|nr:2-(5'-triphosphoribosyl)-3'-dephospho CoA synthase [Streptomyces sp. MB09-02B]
TGTSEGRAALVAFDVDLQERRWSPRGSGSLLAGALFVDALPVAAARVAA